VAALANRHGLQPAAHTALERCLEREQDPGVLDEFRLALNDLENRNL
jgi:hypothetical protein